MTVIVLTQGDDSNALGEEINLVLDTDIDLTGCKAVFQLSDFRQEWTEDIVLSKTLPLIIPAAETKKLKVGECIGGLKIYDKNGLAKTVNKEIKFLIEAEVVKNDKH